MNRRQFVAILAGASLSTAGCAGDRDADASGRLVLVVHNGGTEPITVRIGVVDEEGTVYAEESDRIGGGVARSFEVVVGTAGRHEATVECDDWEGSLAWDAGACARYEGTVRVTDERVEVAGECTAYRE